MEENKRKIIIFIEILVLLGLIIGTIIFTKSKKSDVSDNKKSIEQSQFNENEDVLDVEEKVKDEPFVYSSIYNQGKYDSIIGYNGELYYISESEKGICNNVLGNESLVEDSYIECGLDNQGEIKGRVDRLYVSTDDVANAYVKQSFSTDKHTIMFVLFKNGIVDSFILVDPGDYEKDIFNGEKIKSIDNYECAAQDADGCYKEVFTVTLIDGTTKTIEQ